MLSYMHCRIQDWVDSVCPADNPTAADLPTLESPRADWHAGPPAKRVCHGLDAAFHPSSPPLTDIMDDATPRGRKRPVQLEEMTPRPILSMRKRTSPTKRTTKTTLENLEKPFTFHGMPSRPLLRQRLPKDTIPLYEELFSATEKRAIIPAEMREELEDEGLSPNAFREADVAQGAQRRAWGVYTTVSFIVQKTYEASVFDRHESTWNDQIHTRLLELVFASSPLYADCMTKLQQAPPLQRGVSVRYEKITSAPIASDARSTYSESLSTDSARTESSAASNVRRGENKKVDYVLVMDMPDTSPLQRGIMRAARLLCNDNDPYVNQTSYRPIEKSLIAVSIETKTVTGNENALYQLTMWAVAWHHRMYALRAVLDSNDVCSPDLGGPGFGSEQQPRLPTLPLVLAVGEEWRVYFACDLGTSISVYGPMTIGSTQDIVSTYVLLASLQALKTWVEGTFQDSMANFFQVEQPDAASS